MFSDRFYAAPGAFCTYAHHVNAPYLRKTFSAFEGQNASVTLTSTGFYRLWINGTEVTKCPLAPYITNPDSVLLYDTYDLTPYLRQGENVLGLCLGNGMVNSIGGFVWDFDKTPYRDRPSVAFALTVGEETVEADETLLTHPSPVTFDDLRSGVHYDARLELPGWSEPGFDASDWTPAVRLASPRGEKMACDTDLLSTAEVLKGSSPMPGGTLPAKAPQGKRPDARALSETSQYKPGKEEKGYFVDFGVNASLIPTMRVRGRRGQEIALQFAEYAENGFISYENIDQFYPYGYTQRDVYVCSGEGIETFTPPFTYHGARYCLVIGLDEDQLADFSLDAVSLHSDFTVRGDFECSDKDANLLQSCVRTSDLANFVWFPTDCPHREKNGWTGDAAMSCEQMTQNFGIEKSLNQWLKLIRASQRTDGAIAGIVPTGGWGYAWGNGPAWDQVIVELPYRTYQYRGDLSLFRTVSDTVLRYLHYISSRRDTRGLIACGLGDWVQAYRPSGLPDCPLVVSDSITVVSICQKAAFLFEKAGMLPEKAMAEALGNEVRASVRKHLVDLSRMVVQGECQCAQAMGLYYNIFEPAERPEAYRQLLAMIDEADGHFSVGMIGLRILFRVLASFGDTALAWDMIFRKDAPSYGLWVREHGMTSLAEKFHETVNGYQTSLNHHFLGDVSGFMIACVAGVSVDPEADDPRLVCLRPSLIPQLTHASGFYDTVEGRVSLTWKKKDGAFEITAEAPKNVRTPLTLPEGYVEATTGHAYEPDFKGTIRCVTKREFYARKGQIKEEKA